MNTEFERQLELEAREGQSQAGTGAEPQNNPYLHKDPTDGTLYEWDSTRKAWFPKLDDDFIAKYQANYGTAFDEPSASDDPTTEKKGDAKEGVSEDNAGAEGASANEARKGISEDVGDSAVPSSSASSSTGGKRKRGLKEKKEEEEKEKEKEVGWFDVDDEHNTNVYVSSLPLDTTEDELVELMKKCGLIGKDLASGKLKIKMYRDREGNFKGDALCSYIKVESVELALQILDGYNFKDKLVKVERAKFQLKGDYDPSKKPRKKKGREKEKMKKNIAKLFDWRPEKLPDGRPKSELVLIIQNMFDPKEFEPDPRLIIEYKNDLRDECMEKCGEVRKVEIYDRHPEGVAAVYFKEFEAADRCRTLMNGRFFAGRQLMAFHWDGKTRYKIEETEEEAEKRIAEWEKFLEGEDN